MTGPVASVVPDGDDRDDAALLAAHIAGDRGAFAVLVRRHRDRLWAVALRTLGNREDAADALQEALISAFRRAESFRGDAAVTTWLHRVVVNACLDRIRRENRRPTRPLPGDEEHAAIRAPGPDPFAARDLHLDVTRALAALPAEQRAAIVLVDVQGYPVAEAAAICGVAVGTVKSRCARGRARLAAILTDGNGSDSAYVPPARPASPAGEVDGRDAGAAPKGGPS